MQRLPDLPVTPELQHHLNRSTSERSAGSNTATSHNDRHARSAFSHHQSARGTRSSVYLLTQVCTQLIHNRRSDRKSTRLNSSHSQISYAVFCLKKKKKK